jgi:hypothetical protein
MHAWMQCFNAPLEHFGEGGEARDFPHRNFLFAQQFRGASSGNDIDALPLERARERRDARLVGDRNESAGDFHWNVKELEVELLKGYRVKVSPLQLFNTSTFQRERVSARE